MEKVIENITSYLLVQRNTETREELALNYNSFNGMFNPNYEVEHATRWEDVATVDKLAATQNMIAQLLGQKYKYVVVKENIDRTEVAEEAPAE